TNFTGNLTLTVASGPFGSFLNNLPLGVNTTITAGMADIAPNSLFLSISDSPAYTLRAAATGSGVDTGLTLTNAISPAIKSAPSGLAFTKLPSTVVTGQFFKVVVQCFDPSGLPATHYNGPVSLKIDSGPAGGILFGKTTVNAVGGVATFFSMHLNVAGDYILQAFVPGTDPLVSVTASTAITATFNRIGI